MMVRFILLILSAVSVSGSQSPVEISCGDDGWVDIQEKRADIWVDKPIYITQWFAVEGQASHPSFVTLEAKRISSLEIRCTKTWGCVADCEDHCKVTIGLDNGTHFYTINQEGDEDSAVRQTIKELKVCQQKGKKKERRQMKKLAGR